MDLEGGLGFSSNLLSENLKQKIDEFVEFHHAGNKNVVLITSGGTTVPLEERTVRFIDNFSVGTRGSASAEYFLKHDYAVLFLYRKRSLKPFERKLNNLNLLDLVQHDDSSGSYTIDQSQTSFDFRQLINQYKQVKERRLLLTVEFISVFDYFAILEFTCKKLSVLKKNTLIYLAAAVSDFYMPKSEMPTHKIQSNSTGLVLELKPVPKLVGQLRSQWCPHAFIVTFKLETDSSILMEKCRKALEKYEHHVVVGNILESRAKDVIVVQANGKVDEIHLNKCRRGDHRAEIEQFLVEFLVNLHTSFKNAN